jgi:serine/threonine protein phosphatase PrpC
MENKRFLAPSADPHVDVLDFSHKGLVRENNEDHILVRAFQTGEKPPRQVLLAVLADGVGGHQAGEVASRVAAESIAASISSCSDLAHPEHLLEEAFIKANQQVVKEGQVNEKQKGMGTTGVCALLIEHNLYMANLGDSRLYRVHERQIRQLTFDHTWMEELSQAGLADAIKITRSHPLAHVLNRYLGSNEPIRVDLRIRLNDAESAKQMEAHQGMTLDSGDMLLLSSDGISDLLSDAEICENMLKRRWTQTAKRLVYCALKKGGYDNASVIVIRIPPAAK